MHTKYSVVAKMQGAAAAVATGGAKKPAADCCGKVETELTFGETHHDVMLRWSIT